MGTKQDVIRKDTPKVSIVMPAYNAAKTISQSIQSVTKQSYRNWELITIDDGSKDNTCDIVREYQKIDERIKLIKLAHNGGLPNARNKGCEEATGHFIAFLDSDDLWHENKLEYQINFHLDNPEIEISHTDFHLFNDQGILKRPLKYLIDHKKHKAGQIYPSICYKNPIGVLTVMVSKNILNEVGFFDASLWTMEDQDLWVRIAKMKKAFGYIPQVLAYYRLTPGSITSKTGKYKMAYKKFIEKMLKADNLNANLLFRYYYRHFGTVYFKNQQYKLSRLYFSKSIRLVHFDYISLSTILYMIYGIVKQRVLILKSVLGFF